MTLLTMLFLHIIDDFHLQGDLKNMKQKKWWTEHVQYKQMYRYDYIAALCIHAFSWAFLIMLPLAYKMALDIDYIFCMLLITNMLLHALIDDIKANKMKINLCIDQMLHVGQICVTYVVFTLLI